MQNSMWARSFDPFRGPQLPPSILLLTPEGRSFRRGNTKTNDMAKQQYTHRYNVKLNDAEHKRFEEYYLSYISNDPITGDAGNVMGQDGSKRKIPRKRSDALRRLIDIGLMETGKPVEVGNPRKVNVDSLLTTDIREEIRKIGININQLAKVMNSIAKKGEKVSESTERKISKSLQMGVEHMNDVLKRLLDNLSVMENTGKTNNTGNIDTCE